MENRRLLRVADLLREELSEIIRRQVHDPRVSDQDFTILRVEVSPDLGHAKVHVSTLLGGEKRDALIAGMRHAAGFIRRTLGPRLRMKAIPELKFLYDDGLAQSQHISDLIGRLKDDPSSPPGREAGPSPGKEEP